MDAEYPPEGLHIDDTDEFEDPYLPYKTETNIQEEDDYTEEDLDKYITSQVLLTAVESELMGTVKQHKRKKMVTR